MRPTRSGQTSGRKTSRPQSRRTRTGDGSTGSSRSRSRIGNQPELLVRVLTAAVGIPVVLYVDHLGGWPFGVAVAAAAAIGTVEFYHMLRQAQYHPFVALGVLASAGMAALPIADRHPQAAWIGTIVACLLLTSVFYLQPATSGEGALLNWALSVVPVLYVGLLLGHLTLLRDLSHGVWWVIVVLVITWAYDTGAFFAGRAFGQHGFMQHISPKKTMEGVAGGLLLAALAGFLAVPTVHLPLWQGPTLGLITGLVAQVGDLVESLVKRQVGAKDSGAIMPGHGGLLDRIDSLLYTGAVTYYFAMVAGHGS